MRATCRSLCAPREWRMVWTDTLRPPPATVHLVERFYDAINRHDLTVLGRLLAPDTVLENGGPARDGTKFEGKTEVLGFWQSWFASHRDARFDVQDVVAAGEEQCTIQ